jgi:hypothetical protein
VVGALLSQNASGDHSSASLFCIGGYQPTTRLTQYQAHKDLAHEPHLHKSLFNSRLTPAIDAQPIGSFSTRGQQGKAT